MCIKNTRNIIDNCFQSKPDIRLSETAFTRNRNLGPVNILRILLYRLYKALQLCLDDYFDAIDCGIVSKQAFSKARQDLNPEFVRKFFDMSAELAVKDDSFESYKGMRLIAIDGSDIAVENSAELKEAFGCSGSKKNAATALCSIAYAPLEQVIYDCQIDRYDKDERDLAELHIERLISLGLKGSLLIFDRWYPSAKFIAFLYESGFPFLMRVRNKWNKEVDGIKTQGWISIAYGDKSYPVRTLKTELSTGETETLLTSLNQKQLPIAKAGDLYFKRWAVETAYDSLKSKLQLENFSGKTKVSVLQDFYATVYLANLSAFIAGEADEIIKAADKTKKLRYPRRANRNRTINKLRNKFIFLLLEPDELLREAMLDKIIRSIVERPLSVVDDRSPDRKSPRKKRFHMAKKSVV